MNLFWLLPVVIGLIIFVWLLPARWDPAIKFKEWTEGWHDDKDQS